jgi:uncharacterized membrane protein YbhN (UPF0104 family)
MKRALDFVWPLIGIAAVLLSGWLLFNELKNLSAVDVLDSLAAIPLHRWALAVGATLVAYGALAWYDRIALLHLGKPLGWGFISLVSFTTYALSHNIGASVISGAAVRYRAYSTKGLNAVEIGILVALCSFTFGLGTIMLGGFVLIGEPELVARLFDIPETSGRIAGFGLLMLVGLYVLGSVMGFRPLRIGRYELIYPRPMIVLRQLFAAPIELLGAAGIIYFALPEAGNPGFFVVAGVFLGSFSAALLSNAPGGLGVLEFVFLKAMPDVSASDVIAALLVFRLLYLLIPLLFACVVVIVFERQKLLQLLKRDQIS